MLYPKRCLGCDKILRQDQKKVGFCRKCSKEIFFTTDKVCMKCGQPIDGIDERCSDCKKRHHEFVQHKALFSYKGVMPRAMYRFKYGNRRCYADIFSYYMIKKFAKWLNTIQVDAIIPVPMYKRKKKKRGYNQAEVLARELAKRTGIDYRNDLVVRICDTQPMKQLNDVERKYNLQNAFKIAKKDVNLNKVMLIDDIYTTGSTMDHVAAVLRAAGVREVYCMSVCIGDNTQEV
ncbi:MAG: ComF family protein [Pseudobutyrivibrio sp.]|nr:ComF family protein [Pseudobutyrivibrio sp.]